MAQLPTGGIPLFRLFGVQVYLHWTWLIVAMIEVQYRRGGYGSIVWNIAEYLALFGIVLVHEFGHALACKSVGGKAERIMLWPLGGVAFVQPPQRPGAVLWSIAAGPLVNVVLLPITLAVAYGTGALHNFAYNQPITDAQQLIIWITIINFGLLVFNMLPIFPLDGGQILRALLWFVVGAGRSLQIASIIGLIGAAIGGVLALMAQSFWLVLIAAFAALQSWGGFQQSRALRMLVDAPRRGGVQCPRCGNAPPIGPAWKCQCGQPLDIFESQGVCPGCGAAASHLPCPNCNQLSPSTSWFAPQPAAQER